MNWRRVMAAAGCCALGLGAAEQPVNTIPIELPVYTVTDTRELPPPEQWLYASFPGFEVISGKSERITRDFLREFRRFHSALDLIWPGVARTPTPTLLVLCGEGRRFNGYLPEGQRRDDRPVTNLSFRDREVTVIVSDFQSRTINLLSGDPQAAVSGPAASAQSLDPGAGETAGASGGDPGIAVDTYQQFYREYVRFLITGAQPRGPAWFEEGLAQLLMNLEITDTRITVGKVEDPNRISLAEAAQRDLGTSSAAPREERGFNAVLQNRGLMDMAKLLAVERDSPEARNTIDSTWAKQCYAFVHWGLYGDNGRNQKAFLRYLVRSGRERADEKLFQECFGLNYQDMLFRLRTHIEMTRARVAGFEAAPGQRIPLPPPVEVRPATEAEVGRIRGETLARAGNLGDARTALVSAYVRGERDPQLLASLGLFEQAHGEPARARKFLAAAVQARAPRPRAWLELARLRYAEARAAAKDGRLEPTAAEPVLALLREARVMPPPLAETYRLLADVGLNTGGTPSATDLAALDEGMRVFPQDLALVYAAAQLKARAGQVAEATALVEQGLRRAPNDAIRARFTELKAALPPGAPAKP